MTMRYLALLWLAGCFLPVATGAPEPATTVGKGHIGAMASAEAPTLDLIANSGSGASVDYTSTYGESPAASMRFTLSYGLTDDVDLELAAEGELWLFFLPLPTGGSAGLRAHVVQSDVFDVAIAGRIGGVSSGATATDSSGLAINDEASAVYGAVQGVVQTRHGFVRPLLSVNLMPFKITRAVESEPIQRFKGIASSVTLGLMLVGNHIQFGPYATLTNFESEKFAGGFFASGGLMLAVRPDRNRPPPLPYVYAPPPGYAPPPYMPPPAPAPSPPPPPGP
jgi:hypothetical protein